MIQRPRRLRSKLALRHMVRETRMSTDSLILPLFLVEGENVKNPISSLEGHYHYSCDRVLEAIDEYQREGINSFILFGLPNEKDSIGSGAYAHDGVVQNGARAIKSAFPSSYIISDVCMCEYTDHGHCGILDGEHVDNDETLKYLAKIAVSHAQAGVDMVAPSDMMDGRVSAIRTALDENGFIDTPIMSYSAKYASSFYGPFRAAANSAPAFGDRKSYQMDYHNSGEALKEVGLDVEEGSDIIMVKPALSYLDIIKSVKDRFSDIPLAAYSVSGEFAMIKAAAKAGLIDEHAMILESATSIFRAGADILITYFAKEIAQAIKSGEIG